MSKRKSRRKPLKGRPVVDAAIAASVGGIISVSRKNALARMLDMAIWLWFFEKDPLCVHLLILAPYNCLEALGKKTGKGPIFKDLIGTERFTVAYDFLRHASSNPNDGLNFTPFANAPLLFDAINSFDRIFGNVTIFMRTFRAYFSSGAVMELSEDLRQRAAEFFPDRLRPEDVTGWSRVEFFAKASEMFAIQYRAVPPHPGKPS
jgi:hypothetical protein